MKKYIYISALLFVIMSANFSCKKFLDYRPDDMLTMEMIFNDRIRTEDWLSGVYSGVPQPFWGMYKADDPLRNGYAMMGDDLTIPAAWQQFGWRESYAYTMGNWSAPSAWGAYYWVQLPRRIREGLIFIENVKTLPDKDMEQAYVDLMKGEARFLIAYYYWLMLEVYGPIPFSPGKIWPTETPQTELNIPQTPIDSIVNYLDKEFLEVAEILPPVWDPKYLSLKRQQDDQSAWGRATSVMALAIRARMLMHYASPLLNGNPDYANVMRKDGVHLFPTSYDANKWKRAADACKLLIDRAHGAGYKLYYEYNDDGSIDPFMSYYNAFQKKWNEGNKEIIFGRPDNPGFGDWQNHHLPIGIGGNGGMGVTQELVDAFFMKNGLPITDPSSGYSEQGFSSAPEVRKTKWRGAEGPDRKVGQVTLEGTFNMYCNREPRFYASVIYNEAWLGVANRRADFYLRGRDGGPSFDAPQNGYNVRKRISLDVNPRGNVHPYQPGILHRLAEFYLAYAEALNESDPGNSEILTYINRVRERAGIPGLTAMSQSEMREAIIRERRVEFNCEGIRIHDLRRWKLAEQYLGNRMYGMNFLGTKKSDNINDPEAYYKRTFSVQRSFNKRQYLWPVPQAQMDINPNLVQMPGY